MLTGEGVIPAGRATHFAVWGDGERLLEGRDFNVNHEKGCVEILVNVKSIAITTSLDGTPLNSLPPSPKRKKAQWKSENRKMFR